MSKNKHSITAIIPARNEEVNIARCLESLKWCDNVIVLDSGTDKTAEIAKQYGAEVVDCRESTNEQFVSVQRNINITGEKVQTDWILRIDADEVVTPELREEIEQILDEEVSASAYGIPRKQFFWGGFLKGGDWAYDRLIRLYKKGHAHYSLSSHVHEQYKVVGEISYLSHHLLHYSHPTLAVAVNKFNTYTSIEIKDLHTSKLTAIKRMILLPPYIFLRWMIWHHGYRDGLRGVVAGAMRAWYEFILYAKYLEFKKQT